MCCSDWMKAQAVAGNLKRAGDGYRSVGSRWLRCYVSLYLFFLNGLGGASAVSWRSDG
jgi:hypothetical protein